MDKLVSRPRPSSTIPLACLNAYHLSRQSRARIEALHNGKKSSEVASEREGAGRAGSAGAGPKEGRHGWQHDIDQDQRRLLRRPYPVAVAADKALIWVTMMKTNRSLSLYGWCRRSDSFSSLQYESGRD